MILTLLSFLKKLWLTFSFPSVKDHAMVIETREDQMDYWTPEKTQQLRDLFDKGLTGSQMGQILHYSRNAIIGKLHRLKLTRAASTNTETRKQRKQEQRNSGASFPPRQSRARIEKSQPQEREMSPSPSSAPPSLNLSIFQLERGRCRWPEGDPVKPGFSFCGHQTFGPVYCYYHATRAYNRK